jgi:hypothetical protein
MGEDLNQSLLTETKLCSCFGLLCLSVTNQHQNQCEMLSQKKKALESHVALLKSGTLLSTFFSPLFGIKAVCIGLEVGTFPYFYQ